ncbi:GNAT family N-acetyltransferase [Rhodovulum sp. YNF3179]|uniref:GNAT family N-acetyltransferase n=1 Tax=Rhodovulum sp. YNF3179 TaxID=3425127 RepID=UPI003D357A5C
MRAIGRPRLRRYRAGDAAATHDVFFRAVHEGAGHHYSTAERAAWAPGPGMPRDWPQRLGAHLTWVALKRRRVVGFATLGRDGHLDLFYVLPEAMGGRVAPALYDRLEAEARARALPRMDTAASHLARSFLARRGWAVLARQSVIRDGVPITNFRMEKLL